MGPIAIPFMLGLLRALPQVRPHGGAHQLGAAACSPSTCSTTRSTDASRAACNLEYQVSLPLAVSLVLYIVIGYIKPEDTPERDALIEKINTDDDGSTGAAAVPAPAGAAGRGGRLAAARPALEGSFLTGRRARLITAVSGASAFTPAGSGPASPATSAAGPCRAGACVISIAKSSASSRTVGRPSSSASRPAAAPSRRAARRAGPRRARRSRRTGRRGSPRAQSVPYVLADEGAVHADGEHAPPPQPVTHELLDAGGRRHALPYGAERAAAARR